MTDIIVVKRWFAIINLEMGTKVAIRKRAPHHSDVVVDLRAETGRFEISGDLIDCNKMPP